MRFAPFIRQRHHITYLFQLAARQRMQNRALFIKTVPNPSEKTGQLYCGSNAESRRALRQHNREQIKQHPEWFPAPLKASDRRWQALAENNHFLSSDHLHNITEVAIHRLEQQLGKPYVWGGTRPDQGFDCSGLVFYAYNKILEAKLPRTANEMYHYHRATIVANNDLRREICCFPYPQPRDSRSYGRVFGRWAIYRVATYRRNHSDKPISRTFLAGPFFGRAQDFDGRDDFVGRIRRLRRIRRLCADA